MRSTRQFLLLLALSALSVANASVPDALNFARHKCGASHSILMPNKQLNAAAMKLSQGLKPNDAARSVGYSMTQLASIHLEGFNDESELQALLLQQSCKFVGDQDAREVGYFQRGSQVWILIGAARGDPGSPAVAAQQALMLVNKARAVPRRCGSELFAAAAPLILNAQLTLAAQRHSDEMARLRYLEHVGKDRSTPASRIAGAGYTWTRVGENIAAGEGSVDLVISDWLGSPHHCANIMDSRFMEMGIAFASNKADQEYGVYWTQTFGTPKKSK